MSTVQIAKWAADRLNKIPEDAPVDGMDVHVRDGNVETSVFLGSTYGLDPCGRYHHMLSPNGVTQRCEQFWESLERQLEKRGLWLDGEDDMAIRAVRWLRDANDEDEAAQEAA